VVPEDQIHKVELEELCDRCDGEGRYRGEYPAEWRRCDHCNGAGFVPTEFGEKVLTLMRHNFKPMLQDANDE
jgi:DnaJ-class molecular chaperone